MPDIRSKLSESFSKLKNRINSSGFLQGIMVLAGGSAISQLIIILAYPLLTRLYSPEDFGTLAAFVSVSSFFFVIASFRYELAISLPDSEDDAVNILALCILALCISTILSFVVIFFYGSWILSLLKGVSLESYIWLLPISLFSVGLYQILSYWAIRKEAFGTLAKTKMSQSFLQIFFQSVLGLTNYKTTGLIVGDICGRVGGSWKLASITFKNTRHYWDKIKILKMRDLALRYKKFPLISSLSSLLNNAGLQLAPLFIIYFYGAEVGGWFALGQRVIAFPISLIGQSVSQVYIGEASKLAVNNLKGLKMLYLNTFQKLALIAIVPVLLLSGFAPLLFEIFFGEVWRETGEYLQILSIMFLGQFAIVPLSMTLNILEKQDWLFFWDFSRLVIIIGCFGSGGFLHFSIKTTLFIYSISMLILYLGLFFLSYRAINTHIVREVKEENA